MSAELTHHRILRIALPIVLSWIQGRMDTRKDRAGQQLEPVRKP